MVHLIVLEFRKAIFFLVEKYYLCALVFGYNALSLFCHLILLKFNLPTGNQLCFFGCLCYKNQEIRTVCKEKLASVTKRKICKRR